MEKRIASSKEILSNKILLFTVVFLPSLNDFYRDLAFHLFWLTIGCNQRKKRENTKISSAYSLNTPIPHLLFLFRPVSCILHKRWKCALRTH